MNNFYLALGLALLPLSMAIQQLENQAIRLPATERKKVERSFSQQLQDYRLQLRQTYQKPEQKNKCASILDDTSIKKDQLSPILQIWAALGQALKQDQLIPKYPQFAWGTSNSFQFENTPSYASYLARSYQWQGPGDFQINQGEAAYTLGQMMPTFQTSGIAPLSFEQQESTTTNPTAPTFFDRRERHLYEEVTPSNDHFYNFDLMGPFPQA